MRHRQLGKDLYSEVLINTTYKEDTLPARVTIDVNPYPLIFHSMKSVYLFAISFATPILGALPDLTKLPDVLEDISKLPDEEAAWKKVTCDHGSLTSKFNDPFEQWNDAKASEAFADAYNNYKDKKHEQYGFTSSLFDFFHANPTINCQDPLDVGCSSGTECGQADWPNAVVSAPAG